MAAGALLLGALVLGCGGDGQAAERPNATGDAAPVGTVDPADTAAIGLDPIDALAPGPGDEVDGSGNGDSGDAASGPFAGGGGRDATPPSGGAGGSDTADGTEPGGDTAEPASGAQDPSTAEILRETSRAYEGLRSFRADFQQELRNALLGRTTRSSGTLYQRQPDRFLMDFSDPEGDIIVSDGEWFWMYFPSVDDGQVLRSPRGGQGLDLRAQFVGDPVRRFEATYHGSEEVRGRASWVLTLDPREPAGYERLKVWIDADDHLVRRFELTEANGNLRRLELSDFRANPSLPDDLFEFAPPEGAQVVTRG
jgi:outer membrane lipoprotein carrier protein